MRLNLHVRRLSEKLDIWAFLITIVLLIIRVADTAQERYSTQDFGFLTVILYAVPLWDRINHSSSPAKAFLRWLSRSPVLDVRLHQFLRFNRSSPQNRLHQAPCLLLDFHRL